MFVNTKTKKTRKYYDWSRWNIPLHVQDAEPHPVHYVSVRLGSQTQKALRRHIFEHFIRCYCLLWLFTIIYAKTDKLNLSSRLSNIGSAIVEKYGLWDGGKNFGDNDWRNFCQVESETTCRDVEYNSWNKHIVIYKLRQIKLPKKY